MRPAAFDGVGPLTLGVPVTWRLRLASILRPLKTILFQGKICPGIGGSSHIVMRTYIIKVQ